MESNAYGNNKFYSVIFFPGPLQSQVNKTRGGHSNALLSHSCNWASQPCMLRKGTESLAIGSNNKMYICSMVSAWFRVWSNDEEPFSSMVKWSKFLDPGLSCDYCAYGSDYPLTMTLHSSKQ